jgi:hypothetical protein
MEEAAEQPGATPAPTPAPNPGMPREVAVDPYKFWVLMCHPEFERMSFHHGRIGPQAFYCPQPPDSIRGLVSQQVNLMMRQAVENAGKQRSLMDKLLGFGRRN